MGFRDGAVGDGVAGERVRQGGAVRLAARRRRRRASAPSPALSAAVATPSSAAGTPRWWRVSRTSRRAGRLARSEPSINLALEKAHSGTTRRTASTGVSRSCAAARPRLRRRGAPPQLGRAVAADDEMWPAPAALWARATCRRRACRASSRYAQAAMCRSQAFAAGEDSLKRRAAKKKGAAAHAGGRRAGAAAAQALARGLQVLHMKPRRAQPA